MTDTQDDCRRAFERWYNDFPVGGRAAKEGLAWTVWQAAWSTRPSAAGDDVRLIECQRQANELLDALNRTIALLEDQIKGMKAISAMQPAQPNVDELVGTISKEVSESIYNEDFDRGYNAGMRQAIALIRKWAEEGKV